MSRPRPAALAMALLIAIAPPFLHAQRTGPDMPTPVPGFLQPRPQLFAGGQPAASDWQAFADAGVRHVVNLRTAAEMDGRDEATEVQALGMAYDALPVAGAEDITPANADALWRLVDASQGAVLVHCASGNRVGALLALGAARHGMPATQALAFGKAAGLAGAEPRVRMLLDLPQADVSAPASR